MWTWHWPHRDKARRRNPNIYGGRCHTVWECEYGQSETAFTDGPNPTENTTIDVTMVCILLCEAHQSPFVGRHGRHKSENRTERKSKTQTLLRSTGRDVEKAWWIWLSIRFMWIDTTALLDDDNDDDDETTCMLSLVGRPLPLLGRREGYDNRSWIWIIILVIDHRCSFRVITIIVASLIE